MLVRNGRVVQYDCPRHIETLKDIWLPRGWNRRKRPRDTDLVVDPFWPSDGRQEVLKAKWYDDDRETPGANEKP